MSSRPLLLVVARGAALPAEAEAVAARIGAVVVTESPNREALAAELQAEARLDGFKAGFALLLDPVIVIRGAGLPSTL